jgi:hypothetical protein
MAEESCTMKLFIIIYHAINYNTLRLVVYR